MITDSLELQRKDFPMLKRKVHGHSLIYFDNAATTFKPQSVIDAITHFYENEYATVHRGIYQLAEASNERYYQARLAVQSFINAAKPCEVIFTSGTTESINLIARTFPEAFMGPEDEILIPKIEHHSNFVPWQMVQKRGEGRLKFIEVNSSGEIDLEDFKDQLNSRTKLVSLAHISNALGVIHPVKEIIQLVRKYSSAKVLIDGAQAVAHTSVDVQDIDADFYVFSAHKMYGPTGMGILYGKEALLEKMPPFKGGGDMIDQVSVDDYTTNQLPYKFEAGTPHIAGACGLLAAIEYVQSLDLDAAYAHENQLLEYAKNKLEKIPQITLFGPNKDQAALVSFVVQNAHCLDVATLLNFKGIALRSGHLCAQPALTIVGEKEVLRISFAFYNTFEEIDRFIDCLKGIIEKLCP